MEISIIEKLHNTSDLFRKQREKMLIQKFNTKYKGMNQKTCNCIHIKKYFIFGKEGPIFHNVLTSKSQQSDVDIIRISKYITAEFFWLTF